MEQKKRIFSGTPLPGKTDGEPKDDVDKLNQTTFVGLNA